MTTELLLQAVNDGLSQRLIADRFGISHTTARYWLNKFGLRTVRDQISGSHFDFCNVCDKPTESGRRVCPSCWTKVRRYRTKALAILLLGGKCRQCGWTGHQSGFTFHHREDKEFTIGNVAHKSLESLLKELKKCDLMCATCHHILHSTRSDPRLIAEAERYMQSDFAKVAQLVAAPV